MVTDQQTSRRTTTPEQGGPQPWLGASPDEATMPHPSGGVVGATMYPHGKWRLFYDVEPEVFERHFEHFGGTAYLLKPSTTEQPLPASDDQ